jgi:hypothetical protein
MNRLCVSIGVDDTYHGRDRASPNGFSISDITCQPWVLILAVGDAYVYRAIRQPEELLSKPGRDRTLRARIGTSIMNDNPI